MSKNDMSWVDVAASGGGAYPMRGYLFRHVFEDGIIIMSVYSQALDIKYIGNVSNSELQDAKKTFKLTVLGARTHLFLLSQ